MSDKRGLTYQVSAFFVEDPPGDGVTGPHPWMAVATAHVFDRNVEVKGLNPAGVILSGEVMRTIHSRAAAATEGEAVVAALKGLLFQLQAKGLLAGKEPPASSGAPSTTS